MLVPDTVQRRNSVVSGQASQGLDDGVDERDRPFRRGVQQAIQVSNGFVRGNSSEVWRVVNVSGRGQDPCPTSSKLGRARQPATGSHRCLYLCIEVRSAVHPGPEPDEATGGDRMGEIAIRHACTHQFPTSVRATVFHRSIVGPQRSPEGGNPNSVRSGRHRGMCTTAHDAREYLSGAGVVRYEQEARAPGSVKIRAGGDSPRTPEAARPREPIR